MDVHADHLGMGWTYGNLLSVPALSYMPLSSNWRANVWSEIDGRKLGKGSYCRAEGFLPVLTNTYNAAEGTVRIEIVGGATAAIARIEAHNTDSKRHRFNVVFSVSSGSFGEVPGYVVDGEPLDYVSRRMAQPCGQDFGDGNRRQRTHAVTAGALHWSGT